MTYSPLPAGDTSSAILAIRNLSVEVAGAGNRVVRNLSLDVHAGETVCVVGESGSGKSVTSLAVMGLLPQGILKIGAGSIRVEGEDVATATPRRLRELRATRMAMVFQEPMTALNPVHTVGKQVDEVLRLHRKMSAAERRARCWRCSARSTCPTSSASTTPTRTSSPAASASASSSPWR